MAEFHVIIGEEILSLAGEITGLFLQQPVPRGLSPTETVKRIKDQGGLVSIPHPFDRFRRNVISEDGLKDILPYADIIEVFNSRNNLKASDREAEKFANENGLVPSGVTDAHTLMELGRTYVEMGEFDGTPEGFMDSLKSGTIVGRRMSPLIHVATTLTKLEKRLTRPFRGGK